MLDHHDARQWADHHAEFSAWAGGMIDQTRLAFAALVRIQYAAPWRACDDRPAGTGSQLDEHACHEPCSA